ncbi:MAG TPA: hypothetical protein VH186_25720 [Chloroflexia bacterium]|nr:hypothetical protein [Chloroflexia bacterium]
MKSAKQLKNKRNAGSAGRIVLALAGFAVLHSLLASRQAKQLTEELAGTRYRNGLYRLIFNIQSLITFGCFGWWYLRLPDRELYRVPWPWAGLMRLAQLFFIILGYRAVKVVGLADFWGIRELQAMLSTATPDPEPEAQGPPLAQDGSMLLEGPFKFSRHVPNFAPLGVLFLLPRMTVNRATFTTLTALYMVIGSWHEEYRLKKAYGQAYENYQDRVAFVLNLPVK